jgi:hypothetical protein
MDKVKFLNNLEMLLKEKENNYGSFDHTSQVWANYLSDILSIENNKTVRVPLKTFGIMMIFLKLWRIMQSQRFKQDNFTDINGYTELLKRLVINEKTTK